MSDHLLNKILSESQDIKDFSWRSKEVVSIKRNEKSDFNAVVFKKNQITFEDVEPFIVNNNISIVVKFPKVGSWRGDAIEACESHNIAWGRFGVLLRALSMDDPENSDDPEIAFSRRALSQHTRVRKVSFESDHLLKVHHDTGKIIRVALVYEYDLSANDVRNAVTRLGKFDALLKTNPNGSVLNDAYSSARSIGAEVYKIRDLMSYLAKLR
ncbi:hypothetical protein [Methylobacterium sp. E-045]|uniref:hypothetical protein n=1 Tax=Methylobacterium sp. E-045 TaxID=2836575 RepID=UPI001FB958A2|nr:hypothetical protein [Methylobacterium sp. E-045]MCJ2130320.1 hypothetical protein [Methylobacterium sp. E-045]